MIRRALECVKGRLVAGLSCSSCCQHMSSYFYCKMKIRQAHAESGSKKDFWKECVAGRVESPVNSLLNRSCQN